MLESRELALRIRGEIPELDRVVRAARRSWEHAVHIAEDQDVYLGHAALSLHGFYNGLEGLFELVAVNVDHVLPSGDAWHRILLRQMQKVVPECRPAVLRDAEARQLEEFLSFRHLVRNIYVDNLDASRMKGMFIVLADMWARLQEDLLAFAAFLEAAPAFR
jgi:hypothetical protein